MPLVKYNNHVMIKLQISEKWQVKTSFTENIVQLRQLYLN